MVIKEVGAMSLAKVAAVLYAGIGVIIGALFSLFAMAGAATWASQADAPGGAMFGVLFGIGAIVVLPICYGLFGFVATLVGAALFNVAARMTGGVRIEVQ